MIVEKRDAQTIAQMSEQELFDSEITMTAQMLEEIAHFIIVEPSCFDPPDDQVPACAEVLVFRNVLLGS